MPEHHKVPVVRIKSVKKHPNADTLSIIGTMGYQTVVKTEDFKVGDLAIFIPPDSVVPDNEVFHFLAPDTAVGEKLERQRRIKARKFRKEWSEGLLMPMSDFPEYSGVAVEGNDLSVLLGINHYNPPEPGDIGGQNEHGPKSKFWPRSAKGWWYFFLRCIGREVNGNTGGWATRGPRNGRPEYDVENYKHFTEAFQPGEPVIVTEKIHGSNARYTFEPGGWFGKGKMYVGSRRLWKSARSKCIWRTVLDQNPWIEDWCREHPGYTLYAEVVPTQKNYFYGATAENPKIFAFDVRTPEGEWWAPWDMRLERAVPPEHIVPIVAVADFQENLKDLADGQSQIYGAKHIRRGL